MGESRGTVRRSVSVPADTAKRVRALAETRKTSANRVLADLIEAGPESKEAEKRRFVLLVSRLTEASKSGRAMAVEGRPCADDGRHVTHGEAHGRLAIHPADQLAEELTALGMSAANLAGFWLNLQTLCDCTRPAVT